MRVERTDAVAGIPPDERFAAGAQVGRYVVREWVGTDGRCQIYRARDVDRDVLLHTVSLVNHHVADALLASLSSPADILARLAHDNLLALNEVGLDGTVVYLVTEDVAGQTLLQWIRGTPPTHKIVEAFLELGAGLDTAHRAGLVHGNVQPSNVLVTNDGRLVLSGFGLPSPRAQAVAGCLIRRVPGYTAPEVDREGADAFSDQFGFAAMFFEALHGVPPFTGDGSSGTLDDVLAANIRVVPTSSTPPVLTEIAVRGLAARRHDRFPTIDAMLATIRAAARRVTPTMFGRYRIRGRLAKGGMAEVWAAELVAAGGFRKPVVIKRILPELARNPQFLSMLATEARTAARLTHPNVCSVFEFGEVDGEHYIAMEYLRGASLATLLSRGPIEPRLMVAVMIQICDGLHFAHEMKDQAGSPLGLVHRDLSPQNIFLTTEGVVKILDFGVAKVEDDLADKTEAGKVKGKLPYMSPEQIAAGHLDRRSDLWSLGVVMWEGLVGKPLFRRGGVANVVDEIRAARVPPLATCGCDASDLQAILDRLFVPDRERRCASALDLRHALLAVRGEGTPGTDLLAELLWSRCAREIRTSDRWFESDLSDLSWAIEPSTPPATVPTAVLSPVGERRDGRDPAPVARPTAPRTRRVWPLVLGGVALAALGVVGWRSSFLQGDPRERAGSPEPSDARVDLAVLPSPVARDASLPPPDLSPPAPSDASAVMPPDAGTRPIPKVTRRKPAVRKRAVPREPPPALEPGRLTVDTKPFPYATIYLDGKMLGVTPLDDIEVPAGEHQLRAVFKDGTERALSIKIEPGKSLKQKIKP